MTEASSVFFVVIFLKIFSCVSKLFDIFKIDSKESRNLNLKKLKVLLNNLLKTRGCLL